MKRVKRINTFQNINELINLDYISYPFSCLSYMLFFVFIAGRAVFPVWRRQQQHHQHQHQQQQHQRIWIVDFLGRRRRIGAGQPGSADLDCRFSRPAVDFHCTQHFSIGFPLYATFFGPGRPLWIVDFPGRRRSIGAGQIFFPPLGGVVLLQQKFCSTGRGSKKINGTQKMKNYVNPSIPKEKTFGEYHFTKWLLSDERFQKGNGR